MKLFRINSLNYLIVLLGFIFFLLNNSFAQSSNYKIYHINAFWALSPGSNSILGKIAYYIYFKENANVIQLNCSNQLTVDSITGPVVSYTHQNNLLSIQLSRNYGSFERDSLQIFYHGSPSATGFGSFNVAMHNGVPVTWTLSQPYGAKDWWPSPGALDYKIDSTFITLETPLGYRGVANGLLVKQEMIDNKNRFYFKHQYPIATYLIAVAATNYTLKVDSVDIGSVKLPVFTYSYPEDSAEVCNAVADNNQTLQLFNNKFGDYPFINEQYGHAQINFGGGMEHQTISFEGYFGEDLLAHELAHQWFGNKITCKSWRDIWLNESFATYCEGLNREWKHQSVDFFVHRKNWNKLVINKSAGSVYVWEDTTDFKNIFNYRLRYAKGAMVLHMLRRWVGDSVFFTSISNYLNDTTLAYGSALTQDFKHHVERVYGKSLESFFNAWIYKQGFPSYTLYWKQANGALILDLTQKASINQDVVFPNVLQIGVILTNNDTILFNTLIDKAVIDTVLQIPGEMIVKDILIDPFFESISGYNSINPPKYKFNDNLLHVYPNPAKGVWFIEYQNSSDKIISVNFFSADGKLVYSLTEDNYNFGTFNSVTLPNLKPDVYLIQIKTKLSCYSTCQIFSE